jgi:hypothetical protein
MHPLARFSRYLATRHALLVDVADEIRARLDAGDAARASDRMWLWVLGAYEVTRTMTQWPASFSAELGRAVSDLKADLERVRVPTTKLERVRYDRRAPPVAVDPDRPPDTWDAARRDLLVGDPGDPFSARRLIERYVEVMGAMREEDVLLRLDWS